MTDPINCYDFIKSNGNQMFLTKFADSVDIFYKRNKKKKQLTADCEDILDEQPNIKTKNFFPGFSGGDI